MITKTLPKGWQEEAACQYENPVLWDLDNGTDAQLRQGRRICGECPVQEFCFISGALDGEWGSTWGGQAQKRRPSKQPRRGAA